MSVLDILKKFFIKNIEVDNVNKNEQINEVSVKLSDEYEKKLALIIKNIDEIDQKDLKNVEYKKIDSYESNDLFTSYRLDFHLRDDLNVFKKKYKNQIL